MNHDSRSFEDELASLKADVAVIRSNYVTKADLQEVRLELKGEIQAVRTELTKEILGVRTELHKALHAQTLRMYAFGAVLVTVVHFVTRAGY
jgi:hypothetical protein